MSSRLRLMLIGSVVLLAGCGDKKERQEGTGADVSARLTLHVKDMAERLDLT